MAVGSVATTGVRAGMNVDCCATSPCAESEDEVVDLAASSGDKAAAAAGTQEPPSVRPAGAGSWACAKCTASRTTLLVLFDNECAA